MSCEGAEWHPANDRMGAKKMNRECRDIIFITKPDYCHQSYEI
jgi:hypothetical protein